MKCVIQVVKEAKVSVDNKLISKINHGFLVYLGITETDTEDIVLKMVDKIFKLRVFTDSNGKMNLNINDVNGELLVVSQFTLYADTKTGNRPSFTNAAHTEKANKFYKLFINEMERKVSTKTGVFGSHMEVSSINDGPITIIIEM